MISIISSFLHSVPAISFPEPLLQFSFRSSSWRSLGPPSVFPVENPSFPIWVTMLKFSTATSSQIRFLLHSLTESNTESILNELYEVSSDYLHRPPLLSCLFTFFFPVIVVNYHLSSLMVLEFFYFVLPGLDLLFPTCSREFLPNSPLPLRFSF